MPVGFPDYYGGLTLPVNVAEGGTGSTSITAKAMLYGAGTSHLVETNIGTSGQVLVIDPVTLVPTWEDEPVLSYFSGGILAIAHGGTGTATPALVAGAGISITGTWPDQTIVNSDDAYFSAAILAVAHGGTGTATPALVAGSNIAITGTWPNNTIAIIASPSFGDTTTTQVTVRRDSSSPASLYLNAGSGQNAGIFLQSNGTTQASLILNGSSGVTSLNGLNPYGFAIGINGFPDEYIVVTRITAREIQLAGGPSGAGLDRSLLFIRGGIGNGFLAGSVVITPGSTSGSGTLGAVILQNNAGTFNYLTADDATGVLSLGAPLPISSGGTGTATPALVAGAGISITGTWPDQTIVNSDDAYFSAAILAVAHGGTGTATPALVAGANITLSGSFPAQTVAVTSPLFLGTAHSASNALLQIGNASTYTGASGFTVIDTNNAQTVAGVTAAVLRISDFGGLNSVAIDSNANIGFAGRVALAGAITLYNNVSTAGAGIPSIVAAADITGQTGAIAATTIFTPATTGFHRISVVMVTTTAGTGGTAQATATWTNAGVAQTIALSGTLSLITVGANTFGTLDFFPDVSTPIKYAVTVAGITGTPAYSVHIRLEVL